MILRASAIFLVIAGLIAPATAQERVTVATQRQTANGALFLAAVRGYFKAEGLDLRMGAYRQPQEVAEAVAAGRAEFGLAAFSPAVFNLAGRGAIAIVAAQVREKHEFEGEEVVAANAAYANGLQKFADLAGKIVAITALGSVQHYQLAQIARVKGFDLAGVTVTTLYTSGAIARAVADGTVDAAILPAGYARDVITANWGRLVGWISEIDEQQTGALFAASRTIRTKRAVVEKFVRAYRRGVADYAQAVLRRDRYGKRVNDEVSRAAAEIIARYVFPDRANGAYAVENGAAYMDPKARIDIADLARQIDWLQAQGFVEKDIDVRDVVDLSFTAGD